MKTRQVLIGPVVLVTLLLTTACFNIEQEVFLNQDGSGEMVVSLSLPDFPADAMNNQVGSMASESPAAALDNFKNEVMSRFPSTVKLKDAKVVQQNGSTAWYAVFEFKNLKDMGILLTDLGGSKKTPGDASPDAKASSPANNLDGNIRCSLDLQKNGAKTLYVGNLTLEPPPPPSDKGGKEKPKAPKENAGGENQAGETSNAEKSSADDKAAELASSDFSKQIGTLVMGVIRMRFILHTPAPITESNADIVLHGNTAVWNSTFLGFLKDKKSIDGGTRPIEMRATF